MGETADYVMSEAIRAAYQRGEEEETMGPIVRVDAQGKPMGRLQDGDYVIFYDIRGEREIELSRTLVERNFSAFPTAGIAVNLATMIEYHPSLGAHVAFPPQKELPDTLCEVVSRAGLRQIKIAESEKSIHIRYFLNGKRDRPFPGEEGIIIESARDVEDFDERPQMHVAEVAQAAIERIADPRYALVIVNFANMDVVGHIEDKKAVLQAIEAVDQAVGLVLSAAQAHQVTAIVTADHGTVEKWYYPDGKVDTGHTDSPVPCVIAPSKGLKIKDIRARGTLCDVAPTVLQLLGLPAPPIMTGKSLLEWEKEPAGGPARVLLLIVDGWGYGADPQISLLAQAYTPNLDNLLQQEAYSILEASGPAVGLPEGTVGNSEAGHLHLGAGRIIPSDRLRVEQAIRDGSFHQNPAFLWAMEGAKKEGRALHLLGIVSFYSSHGSVEYLYELLKMCAQQQLTRVYIHGLLGRRGERPETGAAYIRDIERFCAQLGVGRVVSVIGRHWALDREERWERVKKAYRLLVYGEGTPAPPLLS